jgi:lysozyme
MKTKIKTNIVVLLTLLLTFSCVQEDPCAKGNSSTTSSGAIASSAKCDDTSTDPIEPDPTPPGQTDASSLNKPWLKEDTTLVIDAYEGNSIDWDKMATDEKVVGVIHRSSIGMRVDTKYNSRKKIALERGYLWGAYHFGKRGDTLKQADLFLSLVGDAQDTLMVLDLEDTNSSSLMSIDEAVVFMDYVYEKTGKIPVVYANHSTTKLLNSKVKSHLLFKQSKLWYARFKDNIPDFPVGIWSNYFLWQFSSEINCTSSSCLYRVPGTSTDMDVNVFNGPPSELSLKWNND